MRNAPSRARRASLLAAGIIGSLVLNLVTATPAQAGDVNVAISVAGEITPGVYGRIDLGSQPPPRLVYAQPIVIETPPEPVYVQPIYLHVPPGHAKHWRQHCHEYNACNRPVYFVWSREYEPGYVPGDEQEEHEHGHGHGRHEHDEDHDHGHGHGHGRWKDED